jgi:hypothetical protein
MELGIEVPRSGYCTGEFVKQKQRRSSPGVLLICNPFAAILTETASHWRCAVGTSHFGLATEYTIAISNLITPTILTVYNPEALPIDRQGEVSHSKKWASQET